MKKILKFLIGDAFIKSLIVSFLDEKLDLLKNWMLQQLQRKFSARFPAVYVEMEQMFQELTVENFLKQNPDLIEKLNAKK